MNGLDLDTQVETMMLTLPRTTKPMRDPHDHKWQVHDIVVIGDARWRIEDVTPGLGVKLRLMNGVNHGSTWETTLANLPKKGLS